MKQELTQGALFDAHAHLSFSPDPASFAQWVAARFAGVFSTTVSPADYHASEQAFGGLPKIKVGLGAHPWWVTQGKISAEAVEAIGLLVPKTHFIGEIGLDFGKNGLTKSAFDTDHETKAAQVEVLRSVLKACAQSSDPCVQGIGRGRVFSLHAVRSADVIMDMLQEFDLLSSNTAIFHWFSGSSAQLNRARELGCCFSVNTFMLATKRGREYAKAIPADRLFVETDLPEDPADRLFVSTSEEAAKRICVAAGEETVRALAGVTGRCEAVSIADPSVSLARERYEGALVSAYEQLIELRGPGVLEAIGRNVAAVFGC